MCHNYNVFYYWPLEKRDCKRDVLSSTWFQEELVPFSVYFAVILATPVKDKFKELLCTSHLLTKKRKILAYEKDTYDKLLHYTSLCFINGKGTQRLNYTVQLKAKNIYIYISNSKANETTNVGIKKKKSARSVCKFRTPYYCTTYKHSSNL